IARFPAGLAIYSITTSLWSLGQQITFWRLSPAIPAGAPALLAEAEDVLDAGAGSKLEAAGDLGGGGGAAAPARARPVHPRSKKKKKKGRRRRIRRS
ncbi:MAG: hypothetical protein KJ006_03255, partial [Thermoleophilia bacterium]|nr:hypothetical protein [Thermoleophilia bacterium]